MHWSTSVARFPSVQLAPLGSEEHISRQQAAAVQLLPGTQTAPPESSVLGATLHATGAESHVVGHEGHVKPPQSTPEGKRWGGGEHWQWAMIGAE